MSKRSAEVQITKDDPDTDDEQNMQAEGDSTWKAASADVMAQRKVVKVRRAGISAPTGVAMPAFQFGAAMPSSSTAAAATPAPAAAPAAAAAEPMNALQRLASLQKSTTWECPDCCTNNKMSADKCGACETPRPAGVGGGDAAAAAPAAAPAAAAPVSFSFGAAAPAPAAAPAAAPAEPMNALQRLASLQKSTTWECPDCCTNNKMSADKCGACETPRPAGVGGGDAAAPPALAAAAPAAVGFSFGTPAATATTTSSTDSSSAPAPAFSFGSGAVTFGAAAPAPTPAASTDAAPTFSFGSAEASATSATFGSVPTFGAPAGGFFGANSLTSSQSFGSLTGAAGDAGFQTSSPVQFEASSSDSLLSAETETKEEFKNRTKELTGEEDDDVHLKITTKVYQLKTVEIMAEQHAPTGAVAAAAAGEDGDEPKLVPAVSTGKKETKFIEIGAGELHVNSVQDPATKKTRARLVLREERTKRNVLNAPIFTGIIAQLEGDKFVKVLSFDLEAKPATFLLKFKLKDEAEQTLRAIQTCVDLLKV